MKKYAVLGLVAFLSACSSNKNWKEDCDTYFSCGSKQHKDCRFRTSKAEKEHQRQLANLGVEEFMGIRRSRA